MQIKFRRATKMASVHDALEGAELKNSQGGNLEAALAYARIGWSVFPVFGIQDGRCACGAKDCKSLGKHPMTPQGFKDATRDEKQITSWWSAVPAANIGIPTGSTNGIVVIDVDRKNGGYDSLVSAVEKHGSLPQTVTAKTGGGGMHYYYKYPIGRKISSKVGCPLPGMDVRAEGGFVVAAPSSHASGNPYAWAEGRSPHNGFPVEELPEPWIEALSAGTEKTDNCQPFQIPDVIEEGRRNRTLFGFASSRRALGNTMRSISEDTQKLNEERCKPPLSKAEVMQIIDSVDRYPRGDFQSVERDFGNFEIAENTHADSLTSVRSWGPLPDESPTAALPVKKCFSPVCGDYCIELADSLQVPLDMVGCAILTVVSIACLGTSVYVMPGYKEPTQIYTAIVAPPSERKSAVFSAALQPIRAIGKLINEFQSAEKASVDLKRMMLDRQMAKAVAKGDETEAKRLQAELDQLPIIKLFSPPLTDATPEALARAMAANGGTLSFASAEGGLFNILSGSYSDQPNIDVLLQAYSGEAVYVERIGRDPVIIDHAALSILLALQPQVLERFLGNETLLERGLPARFLYCVPRSKLGHRSARTARPVCADTANRYSRIIQALAKQSYDGAVRELQLTPMAIELYYLWSEEVERNIGPGAPWHGIANGWEGKLVGNTIRLAGLLKMMDSPDCSIPINEGHFSAAVELARYFVDHALAATGKAAGLTPAAREVLNEIKKQGESPFLPYDLRQKLRSRKQFKEGAQVDQALACLTASGYIRLTLPPPWSGVGRKPEALYEMHPELLSRKN